MIEIQRASAFGTISQDGARVRCRFSFRDYDAGGRLGWGALRALNVIDLPAGKSYALGPHSDIIVLTWVESGELKVRTSDLHDRPLKAGSLHAINAGSGVREMTWEATEGDARFWQSWILPESCGDEPSEEIREAFPANEDGSFRILASGFPEDSPEDWKDVTDGFPIPITSESRLLDSFLPKGESASYRTVSNRALYLTVVAGGIAVAGDTLRAGDSIGLKDEQSLEITALTDSTLLLADIPDTP
jgi:redox-sensitive bicupin YhaK (pirin superfamily)